MDTYNAILNRLVFRSELTKPEIFSIGEIMNNWASCVKCAQHLIQPWKTLRQPFFLQYFVHFVSAAMKSDCHKREHGMPKSILLVTAVPWICMLLNLMQISQWAITFNSYELFCFVFFGIVAKTDWPLVVLGIEKEQKTEEARVVSNVSMQAVSGNAAVFRIYHLHSNSC